MTKWIVVEFDSDRMAELFADKLRGEEMVYPDQRLVGVYQKPPGGFSSSSHQKDSQ